MSFQEAVENQPLKTEDEVVYCTVHPNAPANLRCNRCGRPMCTRCAVRTPVGYRCRQCVREQQDKFFNAQMIDYLVAAVVSVVVSAAAAFFIWRLWFFLVFIISPVVGSVIGQLVWRLTGKRRGRYTAIVVGAGVVVGALPFLLLNLFSVGLYLFVATGAAVAQFRLRL
ncbi:MAG: hypothetical protein GXY36_16585 [Chloroflexi bacterium]|nr:hypothetical protein [Chloroflexota bacterium]